MNTNRNVCSVSKRSHPNGRSNSLGSSDLDNGQPSAVPRITRRQLFSLLGVAGLGAGIAACSNGNADGSGTTAAGSAGATSPTKGKSSASTNNASSKNGASRVLVVVELGGGNDGFASLVPYTDARFRKLRNRIWVEPTELVLLDDHYAMAKGLGPMKGRMAFLEGVGVAKPDLSHFAMSDRWWRGDPEGLGNIQTGFLGRCCDAVRGDEPLTGLSLGGGSSLAMVTAKAATASLPQLDMVRELAKDEPAEQRLRSAMATMAGNGAGAGKTAAGKSGLGADFDRLAGVARSRMMSGLELLGTLNEIGERPKRYPDGNSLADAFALTRQLVSLDVGLKIFHIPWGSFDTHSGEVGSHAEQMRALGDALDAFHKDLDDNGLADRVLVATTSEFGRRPEANGSGTDHGTASTMMLSGAVKPGRHGTSPNFARLDNEGNVKATLSMSDYYATLASWLGVPASEVITGKAEPVPGLLSV